jgi:cytochrome c oxidase subunit 1
LHPPSVPGREPLWENLEQSPRVHGCSIKHREVLATTILDATPDHKYRLAAESLAPPLVALVTALTLIVGGIFHPIGAVIGTGILALVLFGWFWVGRNPRPFESEDRPAPAQGHEVKRD